MHEPDPADTAFREEVRQFLAAKLTPELRQVGRRASGVFAPYPDGHPWFRILAERGWSVPSWPVEWGGCGWSVRQHDIFASELAAATPYNTYAITGLPPGPICNPGKAAIAAVLNPETSDDMYFVATGHGGHVFAATNAQQERNVAAYRVFERQNHANEPPRARSGYGQ